MDADQRAEAAKLVRRSDEAAAEAARAEVKQAMQRVAHERERASYYSDAAKAADEHLQNAQTEAMQTLTETEKMRAQEAASLAEKSASDTVIAAHRLEMAESQA